MESDDDSVISMGEEDRLSSLPDELIHKIMSCFDMKFAVQTCLLSSRWELLWKSMPYLNFSSPPFGSSHIFDEFWTHVLSNRNHQVDLSSVKLQFNELDNDVLLKKITNYAFSHNVQELTVVNCPHKQQEGVPPFLLSSHSLEQLTFDSLFHHPLCITPKTPWDFPALETLHLSEIKFCDASTRESIDLNFSKCVNLKNLTLEHFEIKGVGVFDIIAPRLSNLVLIDAICSKVMNVIAPQLENLTVIDCSIKYLNAPPGLSCFCYNGYPPLQLSKDGFHSLNNVSISLSLYQSPTMPYEEEDACETIKMLQKLHSAKYLTLNADIVECISSFPDILSHHPSPFGNLICLTIDSRMRKVGYKVKMSTEARNFFLDNSPNATIME